MISHPSRPLRIGLAGLIALMMLAPLVARVDGADADPTAINRARRFMETQKRGKFISSYLHFGSTYDGHAAKQKVGVTEPSGETRSGHFALIYEFDWDNEGWTTVAFFFDEMGTFYEMKTLKTNAVFNQPFLKADIGIAVLGNVVLELFKDDMTESQRRDARRFIENANSKELLELALQLQQRLGT